MHDIFGKIKQSAKKAAEATDDKITISYSNKSHTIKSIDVSKIGGSKKRNLYQRKPMDEIKNWTFLDFGIYFCERYYEVCSMQEHLNRVAIIQYFPRIHDAIVFKIGFCDEIVLKDYLDHFVENWINFLVPKSKRGFMLRMFVDEKVLDNFADVYDYELSKKRYEEMPKIEKVEKPMTNIQITHTDMQLELDISLDNLLLSYGLLSSLNWLVMKKGLEIGKAVKRIVDVLGKYKNKPEFEVIMNATKKYNPYPSWFVVTKLDKIVDAIDKRDIFSPCNVDFKITVNDKKNVWNFD